MCNQFYKLYQVCCLGFYVHITALFYIVRNVLALYGYSHYPREPNIRIPFTVRETILLVALNELPTLYFPVTRSLMILSLSILVLGYFFDRPYSNTSHTLLNVASPVFLLCRMYYNLLIRLCRPFLVPLPREFTYSNARKRDKEDRKYEDSSISINNPRHSRACR